MSSIIETATTAKSYKKDGGELFIVDNSDSEWKVRDYLKEWISIANSLDIATGYFEIGALLARVRHRGQEAFEARRRLRGIERLHPRLRGHDDDGRRAAPRIPEADAGESRSGRDTGSPAPKNLQRQASPVARCAGGLFLLHAASPARGLGRRRTAGRGRRVVGRGGAHGLVSL